jgi:hypothetical protein
MKCVHHYLWQLACVECVEISFASYICLVATAHTLSYTLAWEFEFVLKLKKIS